MNAPAAAGMGSTCDTIYRIARKDEFDDQPYLLRRSESDSALPIISEISEGIIQQRNDKTKIIFREQSRFQKLQHYLRLLTLTGDVEARTASIAWRVWQDLVLTSSNKMPVPDTGAGPDGEILFTWNDEDNHFETEIFSDGIIEFFYLNHQTDEMWEYECKIGDPIPEEVKDRISLFFLYD